MALSRRAFSAATLLSPLAQADAQPSRPVVLVVNRLASVIAFADPETFEVIGTIPAPTGPHEVEMTPDRTRAVVTGYGFAPGQQPGTNTGPNNMLAVIDVVKREEIGRVDLHFLRAPHGIGVFENYFYFTSEYTRCIGRFDISTGEIDFVRGIGPLGLHMLVVAPNGSKVYTANIVDGTVARVPIPPPHPIPPEQDRIKFIPTAPLTEAIAITPDGAEVWTGSNANGTLTVISTATDEVVLRTPQIAQITFRIAFTPDGGRAFVSSPPSGQIVVVDRYTREVIHRIDTGPAPQGMAVSPDGRRLAVGMGASTAIIDTEGYQLLGRINTGPISDGVVWGVTA